MSHQSLKSIRGMGIIELMIIVGVLAALTAGIMQLVTGLGIGRKQANIANTMENLRSRVNGALSSSEGWLNTLNHANNNGITNCLRDGTVCATIRDTNIGPISIVDNGNNVIFDQTLGSAGFDTFGQPCNTFNPAVGLGDDLCPISLTAVIRGTCVDGGAGCANPSARITVDFLYNANTTSLSNAVNVDRYRLVINRGSISANQNFTLVEVFNGGNGVDNGGLHLLWRNPGNVWMNRCLSNGSTLRRNWTELDDPADLVTIGGANNSEITLQPGTYRCRATVPGYKVGSFVATLSTTGGQTLGQGGAGTLLRTEANNTLVSLCVPTAPTPYPGETLIGEQTYATIDTQFSLTVATTVRIQMTCEDDGVPECTVWPNVCAAWQVNGAPVGFPYGLPAPSGAGATCGASYTDAYLSQLSCERIN